MKNLVDRELELVSIIMPAYNCEKFISQSIESIFNQTYSNWELIIIDDNSSDGTLNIIEKYKDIDKRVNIFKSQSNNGAALSRNTGVELSKGTYIAFIDSDDLWSPNKLEIQINYMKSKSISFSCTSYKKIDEENKDLDIVIKSRKLTKYNDLLKTCPGNSTVIYNADILGKFFVENIKKRNDYLMWINVIKKADILVGIDEVLASHRIRKDSISSNKLSLIKYHWIIYRGIEELSFIKSLYLSSYWISKGIVTKLRG